MVNKTFELVLNSTPRQSFGLLIWGLSGLWVTNIFQVKNFTDNNALFVFGILVAMSISMLFSFLFFKIIDFVLLKIKLIRIKKGKIKYLKTLTRGEKDVLNGFIWYKTKYYSHDSERSAVQMLESKKIIEKVKESNSDCKKHVYLIEDWLYEYLSQNDTLLQTPADKVLMGII
ncbi:super-infection exclusion protein B [Bacillus sp. LJBS17]|uniref:super-infection exclusion protein B n=1 Tax=Bacillus sp. LJBS17 TaxID=2859227 RepID=UPI001C59BC05|nr:super-infection exclusion protein B [Bacillus sp. LJBS17]QXW83644.1 superinfection exclusion B family protein [Bacillus sp. LJBS17]